MGLKAGWGGADRQGSSPITVASLGNQGEEDSVVKKAGRGGSGWDTDKRKGHCCLLESREKVPGLMKGEAL